MRTLRVFGWVLTLALVLGLLVSPAAAKKKKKKDDLGKSAIEEQLKDTAAKTQAVDVRSEEEKEAAAEKRRDSIKDLGSTATSQRQDEVLDVDPARVDDLLREVESKNQSLVQKFEQLLAKDPTNAKAPEWMFRIAEYKWEMSSYRNLRDMREWSQQLEALEGQGVPEEDWPQPPSPDYGESIEYYKKLVASHASYERLDEVLFKLGDGLVRAGQAKEGVGYLHRLTQAYKDSKYLDRVYLSLGEYYFENHNIGTAQAAYEKIVFEYPSSRVFNYAQYKLAWTYFNAADEEGFRLAIDTFKKVVEHLDGQYKDAIDAETGVLNENKLPQGEVSFRNQAINDLIVAYSEVDGGWLEAREYFAVKLTPDKLRQKMEKFAELMGEKGNNFDRIDIYRWLIEKDPVHARIPTYAERLIDSYFNENQTEKIEGVIREFIEYFEPDGKWALVNKNNPQAYEQARVFAEDKLYSLAASYLIQATAAVDRDAEEEADKFFEQARRDHEVFLKRYPTSQYAYDMNFYYAYILDENSDRRLTKLKDTLGRNPDQFRRAAREEALPDLKSAAQQYQKVIDLRGNVAEGAEDHTQVSSNRQVFVYANILASVDPEWSLEASGSTRNFQAEGKDSETKEAEPLTEQETDLVKSAEQYAALFPNNEDTPGFLWRSAEIYRSRYQYNDAAERFDDLVTNFPKHEYAGQAVGSMFALYNKAENWPKIEYWAEWLIDQKNFKVYTKPELEDAIGYSIGQQSSDLYAAKAYRGAAEKLYTLKKRFPEREELVAPAIMATANIYRDGGIVAEAIDKYEEYRETYKAREDMPLATFEAATLYAQKADFEKAAELFEIVPDEVAEAIAKAAQSKGAAVKKGKEGRKEQREKAKEAAKNAKGEEAKGDDVSEAELTRRNNITNQYVALFNAVQIREGMEQWDKAVVDARRYLALNSDGRGDVYRNDDGYLRPNSVPAHKSKLAGAVLVVSREGTVFHLAEILHSGGQIEESNAQYRTYLDTYPANKPVQIKSILEIARGIGEVGKRGWQRDQDKEFERIDKIVATMTPEEQTKAATLVAEMRFLLADRKFTEFKEIQLEFPVRTLRKRVQEKAKLRTEAEELYRKVVDMKVARWSSAAAYRIGEMALNFRDGFKALPIPDEVKSDPDAEEEYVAWVEDELVYPAEDAAIAGFQFAVDLAHQLKVYNEWSKMSALQLTTLNPDAFPVTSEKGVKTEHMAAAVVEGKFVLGSLERGPKEVAPPAAPTDAPSTNTPRAEPAEGDAAEPSAAVE